MKRTHWILYIVALPWDILVAWPVVLLIRALWGEDLRWETPKPYDRIKGGGGGPCLTCRIREGSFPVTPGVFLKGWYLRFRTGKPWGGTALGHGIFYGPYAGEHTRTHEHIHVEQAEVAMLQGFLVGLLVGGVLWAVDRSVVGMVLFLSLWFTGYLMMAIAGWLTALLRGEQAYWGSTHEESARAQAEKLEGR